MCTWPHRHASMHARLLLLGSVHLLLQKKQQAHCKCAHTSAQ